MAIKRWRELWRTPYDSVHQYLLDCLTMATASLHLSVYGFTDEDMADVIIAKHKAGLTVGIVSDHTQSAGPAQHELLQRLVDNGVEVVIVTAPSGAINHEKCIMVDAALGADANQSYAMYGSLNFSASGEKQENHIQLDNDPVVVADFYQQYLEARGVGLKHPQWQLHPTTVVPQPVPADVAAAGTPPEAPAGTP